MPTNRFSSDDLRGFSSGVFRALGLRADHADIVADDLVKANLRGLDSHGISRLPMYVDRLQRGLVNPRPSIRVEDKTAAAALVDGGDGMGFLAAHRATDEACDRADKVGIGLVGVRRSTHFGMGALYALQAIERGFISMIFTNSSPAIAMWGGRTPFLGAAPLAAGIPGGTHAPYVMDMSMTVIARGKIRLAAMRGEEIPEGLALDRNGRPTTDAAEAFEGVCLPFGGVKGSVLATFMDLMAGAFTGANYGGEVKSLYFDHSEPQNVGHLIVAIRPDLFMALDMFEGRMDSFHARIKALPRAKGCDEVLMPGEPEVRSEQARLREGIPITDDVVTDLQRLAEELSVVWPKPF